MGQFINVGLEQRGVWSRERERERERGRGCLGSFTESQGGRPPGWEVAVKRVGTWAFAASPLILIPV